MGKRPNREAFASCRRGSTGVAVNGPERIVKDELAIAPTLQVNANDTPSPRSESGTPAACDDLTPRTATGVSSSLAAAGYKTYSSYLTVGFYWGCAVAWYVFPRIVVSASTQWIRITGQPIIDPELQAPRCVGPSSDQPDSETNGKGRAGGSPDHSSEARGVDGKGDRCQTQVTESHSRSPLEDLAGAVVPAIGSDHPRLRLRIPPEPDRMARLMKPPNNSSPVSEEKGSVFLQGWFYLGLAGSSRSDWPGGRSLSRVSLMAPRWSLGEYRGLIPLILTLMCVGFGASRKHRRTVGCVKRSCVGHSALPLGDSPGLRVRLHGQYHLWHSGMRVCFEAGAQSFT